MSLPVLIYLAGIVGGISTFMFIGLGLIPLGLTLVLCLCDKTPEEARNCLKGQKLYLIFFIMMILISLALPDKQTIYLMAGAKYSTEIAQSAEAKEVGSKILKVLNQKLDEMGGKK